MVDTAVAYVQLARLLGADRRDDAVALAKRTLPGILQVRPDLKQGILDAQKTLIGSATRAFPQNLMPVDADSRLELLRRDDAPEVRPEPVWPPVVARSLNEVLAERCKEDALLAAGLTPSRSLLFVGPPGVGKTLAARWLAARLGRPLLTLDLAAVMSSFLGRTGNNIRSVLEYARKSTSVLLLDEFDAIAKRRDDATEVGELKRLVTVLLQTVDDWPANGLLIAATNHPELLDPAIWRRFERIVVFPLPERAAVEDAITRLFESTGISSEAITALAVAVEGESFAEVTRRVINIRRKVLVEGLNLSGAVFELAAQIAKGQDRNQRLSVAGKLSKVGLSQRRISEVTGLSRDTMRKHGIGAREGSK